MQTVIMYSYCIACAEQRAPVRGILVPVWVVGAAFDARLLEVPAEGDAAHGAQVRAARQLPRLFDQHADLRTTGAALLTCNSRSKEQRIGVSPHTRTLMFANWYRKKRVNILC